MSETFPQWERGAPYWVWVVSCIHTTLLAILAVRTAVLGFSAVADGRPPAIVLVAVALATLVTLLVAALTRAWRLGRSWAWWVLVVTGFLEATFRLLEVALTGPGVGVVLHLAAATTVLVLLFRPSSRAWVGRSVMEQEPAMR